MDFQIIDKEKQLIGQIKKDFIMTEHAYLKLKKKVLSVKDMSTTEQDSWNEFFKLMDSLSKGKVRVRGLTKQDVGAKPSMWSDYDALVVPTLGRFLIQEKYTKDKSYSRLKDLNNWPFATAAFLEKNSQMVLGFIKDKNLKITFNTTALRKLKRIKKSFDTGKYVIEEKTFDDKFLNVTSYAVYAKIGNKEGFLNTLGEVGALSAAKMYETFGGAKRREGNHPNMAVVEIQTKIKRIHPDSTQASKLTTLQEAISISNKEELKSALKQASQEQLLERLSNLEGADKILNKEKPAPKAKRKF